jgi:hypothetical protein
MRSRVQVRYLRTRLLGLLTLGSMACQDDLLAPYEPAGYNPARIVYFSDPVLIDLPASVPLGSVVTITITTFGGSCIQKGRTDVMQTPGRVDLYPLDIFAGPTVNCPDILFYNTHRIEFVPPVRGDLVVRVHGVELSLFNNAIRRRSVTVERTLLVQ